MVKPPVFLADAEPFVAGLVEPEDFLVGHPGVGLADVMDLPSKKEFCCFQVPSSIPDPAARKRNSRSFPQNDLPFGCVNLDFSAFCRLLQRRLLFCSKGP